MLSLEDVKPGCRISFHVCVIVGRTLDTGGRCSQTV